MKRQPHVGRWITAGLLAATMLPLASTAFADHGGTRRFKGVREAFPVQRVIVRERSSGAGPALAGLIGGFILGAAVVSNAQPVVVHEHGYYHRPVVVYRYYDPYYDDWYDSLDECSFRHHHPRIVQVIDLRSGRCVRTLRYGDRGWYRVSGDYDYDEGYDD